MLEPGISVSAGTSTGELKGAMSVKSTAPSGIPASQGFALPGTATVCSHRAIAVGLGDGVGVSVGIGDAVADGVGDGVGVGLGLGDGVGLGVGDALGDGVGLACTSPAFS